MYFSLKTLKTTVDLNKQAHELSLNGLGGKARTLEAEMFNDRMVDIACTKEETMRLFKAGMFKKEMRR